MKKVLLALVCLICTINAFSQDKDTQQQILDELKSIRSVQDSTYNQRMRAVEARKNATSNKTEDSPSEYSILSGIENNTDSNFMADSWNLYGIFALIFSIWALYYAWRQYVSQNQTQENTKNVPISVQRGKLEALPRHFYRNLVCTGAMIARYKDATNLQKGVKQAYPSESNLLKLQTLPDDIFLPIDIEESSYKVMHELRLLFRNYNIEIQVASEHLSRKHITEESLKEDFDNLLFKPFHLTKKIFSFEQTISETDEKALIERALYTVINEHFTKLKIKGNMDVLLHEKTVPYLQELLKEGFPYFNTLDVKGGISRSTKFFTDARISINRNNCNSELLGFIKGISDDKEAFIRWMVKHYGTDTAMSDNNDASKPKKITYDQLYEVIKPYLTYISGNRWEFKTLFYFMLAIDIAIETDRIGMINFKPEK